MSELIDHYDTAQICLNGHVINPTVVSMPWNNQAFCDMCGESTVIACRKCEAKIRGLYEFAGGKPYLTPSFCFNCGAPFPWLELRRKAAMELVDESAELSTEEKVLFSQSIDDIIRDSPNTTLAATRFKRLMAKMGKHTAEALRSILIDIITEAAKKVLWPEKGV